MFARPLKKDPSLEGLPYIEEDEVNLLDYLIVLFKHKWLILGMVFLAGSYSLITSLRIPDIYRSEATIVARGEEKSGASALSALEGLEGLEGLRGLPIGLAGLGGGGSLRKFEVVLKSRHLSRRVVKRYQLMPRLFEEAWNPEKKKWKQNPAPTLQDAHNALMGMMTLSRESQGGVLSIKFDHRDPRFAKEMVEHYLIELSESLRKETLKDAVENQRFLRRQLEQVSDVLLKEKIFSLLAREIEKETFARAQQYYGLLVLDPPIVPDLNKAIKKGRRRIIILSMIVAFFVAVFMAFFIEYIHNLRTREDPERLKRLKSSLRLKG